MSKNGAQSDYVLPEVTYLERLELPVHRRQTLRGHAPRSHRQSSGACCRMPDVTCDEIFNGLAEACGVGRYFQFTRNASSPVSAQLATVGVVVDIDVAKKDGVVELLTRTSVRRAG